MIIFRTDGNSVIGTGHTMRCLSIADAFRSYGEEAVFAVADASMQGLIEERGYKAFILNTDFRKMSEDLKKTKELIYQLGAEMLIADSYYVTADYLSSLKNAVKLVYIDDLAVFAYPVDVLINYNIYAERAVYERLYSSCGEKLPELLLGVKYAPLRRAFRDVQKRDIKDKCTDILISTGGADPVHLAIRLAEYISTACVDDEHRYHFLIGAMNQDRADIEGIAAKSKNIVLHYNVRDMAGFISSCDIAVSAAGSTLYEICACGVPLITYVLADNQIEGANAFERKGLALNLGDIRALSDMSAFFETIRNLCSNRKKRQMLRDNMLNEADGSGAERIVSFILANNR